MKPSLLRLCGNSFGYGYSLRNHIARSVKCQIAQAPMPLDLTFNSGTPAAPFGTQEHFAFCESVPLECRFSYAEWQGPHDNQTEHLGHLLRHGVPLIWRNGAKNCRGLKVSKFSAKKGFVAEIKRLLRPVNLA